MITYLDTSVLAAFYCPEPLSDKVEEIILSTATPAISSLTEVELVSAVSRKVRENELSRENANKILNQFQSHVDHNLYHWLPVEHHHYQKALSWLAQFNAHLRTLDALHLAVVALDSASFLTADQQLARAAELFGIEVICVR